MLAAASEGGPRINLHILLIEDDPSDAELEIVELHRGGFEVSSDVAQTREEISNYLDRNLYDLVLADYNLPHFRGMEAVDIIREKKLSVPLILVTGALKSVTAVECLKQGATDYVLKDNLTRLSLCVRRALEETRLKQERKRAQDDARWTILSSSTGTPSGLFRPSLLSMYALRTGLARYAPRFSLWERSWRLSSRVSP